METIPILLLLAVGALLNVQAAANVQLARKAGSAIGAAALQLAVGAALLLALAGATGSLGALGRIPDATPWHLVGGLGSAIYVLAGIVLLPRLGALVTVGLLVAGQLLASLALDGGGWLGVPRDPLSAAELAGAVAVLAGVIVVVRARAAGDAAGPPARGRGPAIAFGLLAGAVLPIQGAINAQLRADLDAPLAAATVSFVVAAAAMALVVAVAAARGALPRPARPIAMPWWGWLGGACGAAYVTTVFLLIPEVGAAPVVALTVTGQQLASIEIDRRGLLRLPRRRVGPQRLAGALILLAGVAAVTLA